MPGGVVEKMHGFWRKRAVDTTAYERAMKEQAAKLTILTYGLQRQMAFGPDWGDGSGICTSCHSSMFIGFSGPIPCCFVGHNYVGHNYILVSLAAIPCCFVFVQFYRLVIVTYYSW